MRFIYDFSEPDKFYFILPTGQSGNVMSEHYRDMTEGWIKGNYAVVNTNGNVIRSGGMKKMVIKKRE